MELLVKALKQDQIIALEAVTGFGKSLCLISTVNSFIQQCNQIQLLLKQNEQLSEDQQYFYNTTNYFKSQAYKTQKPPKLIFTSKTHQQLNQFKNVLKDLKLQNITLAARKIYCLNEEAIQLSNSQLNINTACKIIRKQYQCDYCNQTLMQEKEEDFLILSKMQNDYSMNFFIEYCRQNKLCPYYFSKQLAKRCDIVLSPYQYIFQAAQCSDIEDQIPAGNISQDQSMQQNELYSNNILVFDEAHNVPQAASESLNIQITYDNLCECLNDIQYIIKLYLKELQIKQITKNDENHQKIQSQIGSYSQLQQFQTLVKQLINAFNQIIINNQVRLQEEDSYYDFYIPQQFPHVSRDNITICDKIDTFINTSQFRQQKRHQCFLSILSQFLNVIHTIQNQQIYKKHFKFIIQQTNKLDISLVDHKETPQLYKEAQKQNKDLQLQQKYQIEIVSLSPKYIMEKLINTNSKARSIILTSGTLSPMQDLQEEFCLPFNVKHSLPSIFTNESLRSYIITKYNDNMINGSFTTRNSEYYKDAVIQTIVKSVQFINYGGILVFFTSYSILKEFKDLLIKNKQSNKLSIFYEEQNQQLFKVQLDRFQNNYLSQPTIFLAVYGGKLSEGIDFANDMCRIVINVSIPFAPINSPFTQLKKEFLTSQFNGTSKYKQWYNTSAFRTINQSCGRCIRHAKDFGMIILLDQRFARNDYLEMLSKWISQNVQTIELNDLQNNNWLKDKQLQYQQQQEKQKVVKNKKPSLLIKNNNTNINQTQVFYNQTQQLINQDLNQIQNNINTNLCINQNQQQDKQYLYLKKLSLMEKVKKISYLAKQLQLLSTKQMQISFNNFVTNTRMKWKCDNLQESINTCEKDCKQFFTQNKYNNEQQIIALEMCILKTMLMN